MLKATFYAENTGIHPIEFESLLTRLFTGWTHTLSTGCWQGIKEQSQQYMVAFNDTYPFYKLELMRLRAILKHELNQESVLVTIENVEVL